MYCVVNTVSKCETVANDKHFKLYFGELLSHNHIKVVFKCSESDILKQIFNKGNNRKHKRIKEMMKTKLSFFFLINIYILNKFFIFK